MNALKVDFVLIVLRNISRIADLEDINRGSEECDNRRDDEKLFFPAPMMSGRTYATAKARTLSPHQTPRVTAKGFRVAIKKRLTERHQVTERGERSNAL